MVEQTHSQIAGFIWNICNLLRGAYKRNEYRKVILPFTVLRRFDCILAGTKEEVLRAHATVQGKSENIVHKVLCDATGKQFYNLSKLDFTRLLDDPGHLAPNLNGYINGFSPNVRLIMERFGFAEQITRLDDKNMLYEVIKAFANVDLSPERIDDMQMGYIFEELIRIGSEQANEEAGEHFTPREVIRLMVNLLLSPERDLARSHVVKTIFDPACGTGGMLSVAEQYIRELNADAQPILYGQDINDESWAVCRSDMLIKGENAENIKRGCSFTEDGFKGEHFDYMLANPPFGVTWKQQQKFIENERDSLGYDGRFGAGTPRVNDGSLLFLQHMISKMRPVTEGGGLSACDAQAGLSACDAQAGSRLAIVFNGSPLFTGDAGSGESEIRRWIIENDWLEAIVALPDQLFYNTGISTYIWVITNRKDTPRKGKIQLIDARQLFIKMRKSLGNKRNQIGDDQIDQITKLYGDFNETEQSKIFDNEDFGYHKITVDRPLKLNFAVTPERIACLEDERAFQNLAKSRKKNPEIKAREEEEGRQRQEEIRQLLQAMALSACDAQAALSACDAQAGLSACDAQAGAGEGTLFDDTPEFNSRKAFEKALKAAAKDRGLKLKASERKAIVAALGERDDNAKVCTDSKGNPEPDSDLRDTEIVPLKEDIHDYFQREVLPHVPDLPAPRPRPGQFCIYVLKCSDGSFYIGQTDNFERRFGQHLAGEVSWTAPRLPLEPIHWEVFDTREEAVKREHDLKTGFGRKWLKREYAAGRLAAAARQAGAWIDETKTKIGYEIPLNRHFYRYEPPRPLEDIEADIKTLETDIVQLLKDVTS